MVYSASNDAAYEQTAITALSSPYYDAQGLTDDGSGGVTYDEVLPEASGLGENDAESGGAYGAVHEFSGDAATITKHSHVSVDLGDAYGTGRTPGAAVYAEATCYVEVRLTPYVAGTMRESQMLR